VTRAGTKSKGRSWDLGGRGWYWKPMLCHGHSKCSISLSWLQDFHFPTLLLPNGRKLNVPVAATGRLRLAFTPCYGVPSAPVQESRPRYGRDVNTTALVPGPRGQALI
jgi:hypothetical protein